MNRPSREPGWMGEDQVMKKAVGRDGAGRVPRPKGEREWSLEASKFSSLGKPQRAFERPGLGPASSAGAEKDGEGTALKT